MLPVYRGCRVFQHCLSWEVSEKMLHDYFGLALCAVKTMVNWESIFLFRGKSETILLKVVLDIASFRNKTQCPKTNFDFFEWRMTEQFLIVQEEKEIRIVLCTYQSSKGLRAGEGNTWVPGEGLGWYCVLVPALARNFPQVVGRDLF